MMKKIILPVLLFITSFCSAQLNNSWIDYSKTYYKFKLASDTLCRISQATLASAGLANVPAQNFQLWRNGKEIRLYTSVANGVLGTNGYIEFWGEMNDGKADRELYRINDDQLNDRYSLETDTVAYFLTVNPAGNNLRFTETANNAPGTMSPDLYFMRKVDMFFRTQINRGRAEPLGEYIYSSAYDAGEGWTSAEAYPNFDLFQEFFNLNVYTAGPANSLSLRVNAFGNAPNTRNLKVKIYNTVVVDQPMNFFTAKKINVENLPLALMLNPQQIVLSVGGNSSITTDRIVVASLGITYPATFNFNNRKNFSFELAASSTGNYLVIDNFNYGSVAPVLYDLNTGNRYVGDISTATKVKFVLPPSTDAVRKFLLVSQENSNIQSISNFTTRNFINFSNAAQQGTYMIITHPTLYNDGSGLNIINEYKLYRSSTQGGGYNTKIYEIDELTDQFAFGIKKHPAAIRDFIRFADRNFAVKPEYALLIGRGINYMEHRKNESNVLTDRLDLIQPFGWPASDVLLASEPGTVTPLVPIGRIAAVNGTEVGYYLQKVKQYDLAQQTPNATINGKAWMKNMIHVAGGKEIGESEAFRVYMNGYKFIAEDTLFGGYVETFTKTSTGAIQQASSQRIQDLFAEGLGFIGYFGHSSANTFEFNLSNPEMYNNPGKYPFFNVSGCSAGNFYIFDPLRLSGNLTLSEKYVLANQRGSIGFLADTHFGVPPFLNQYNTSFYTAFGKTMYGNTVGNQLKKVVADLGGNSLNLDFFTRIHLEEIALHGDPAIRISYFDKPDYVIEDQLIKISPNLITVAENNFNVKIKMLNMGRAVSDSILVIVKRKLSNNTTTTILSRMIPGIRNSDSLNLTIPINPATDKGLNQLIITLDATNAVEESFETNNTITKDFFIFEDELRPSYPYNFSIVNQQNITFIASTANPLGSVRQYNMEIDTTELFNSPLKRSYTNSGAAGIVEFTPNNFTFTDSTVYYWRVSITPVGSANTIWNSYSFIYLPNGGTGFNQSHFYQHKKSSYTNITLNDNRNFSFQRTPRNLIIRTGLFPYYNYDRINVNLDFEQLELYGCVYNNLQIYVFDSTTLLPWDNRNVSATNGLYGSFRVCRNTAITDTTRKFFEFPYNSFTYRKAAMDFIDRIPNGMYVAFTNLGNKNSNSTFINQWKADTAILGSGQSLYHKLVSIGFTQIDSFTRNVPFLYFYKKGNSSYTPTQVVGLQDSTYIDQSIPLSSTNTSGIIESPTYGPASKWDALHWRGNSVDINPLSDTVKIQIWGVKQDGSSVLMATVAPALDTTIAFIDARIYPYLKLKMYNTDPTFATPQQLNYLRVNALYVPEGAIAPNLVLQTRDTVQQGEDYEFKVAFKNISPVAFDSLIRTKLSVTDRNNVRHDIEIPKRKALVAGDTLIVHYKLNTAEYPGENTLLLDFNPDNDQPEQYHFNNVMFKEFYVSEDKYNPLLDVTFDGIHILNKDIVSAKPAILIKLKDESRFLELKDRSLLTVKLKYPGDNGITRTIPFGDTMRFNPANLATGQNTATIDFNPFFTEDGEYEMTVTGKDVAGNKAGNIDYRILFNVISKPMISNLLNYPNPFTSSTAFVFTITGSEVPQNLRIQIMTITGKIVRDITKDELGPIHIGRNITEYKWDGTDMYGQKLANGVYLYRVITNLNGKKLDKYDGDSSTDKFFKKGYGKMYLMR